ncbi:MAG: (d)CMP kinase [Chloroflexota bacterium]|nr:(d)CMP kinase [Chloroflexota bacterium]
MPSKINVISIDGPAAAGKTVVGRNLAQTLEFSYLDTGIMYRAVTWLALHRGISVDDTSSLGHLTRDNPIKLVPDDDAKVTIAGFTLGVELREPSVDSNVSGVAKVSAVREELVAQQKAVARASKIVMIGRDIGTVVLPNADLKIYLNASAEVRAKRRWQEMRNRGENRDLNSILDETLARDQIDSEREDSPLRPAKDAWELDTDGLDIQQVVHQIIDRVKTL